MKTIIVLCSLAAFATAIPTLIKGNFDELESTINEPSVTIKREKKSPLHDPLHEEIVNYDKENSHIDTSIHKSHPTPAFEGRSLGFKKPIIIKKKFGYHLYRDSDEEMTYADPHEKCRKQVKVKLCDEEPSVSSKNLPKTFTSARLDGNISEKEVEHSIKMAKAAVENLQRDIQKMEQSSAKLRENPRSANLASDAAVQEDIEVARKALEHITQNFENLDSMEIHTPRGNDMLIASPTDEERIAQWKDAIENIHRNFEIARNIEDAFRSESHNSFPSDNRDATKLNSNQPLNVIDHQIQEKSNDELQDGKNALTKGLKTLHEDENVDLISNIGTGKSSTAEEQPIEENDMFTSTTNNKEFKLELHSDSLRKEKNNNMEKETRMDESNLDEHLSDMKNAETVMDQVIEPNVFNTELQMGKNALPEMNHENMNKDTISDVKNKETSKLAREVEMESIHMNKKDMKKEHENSFKSSDVILDQTHAETKALPNSDNVKLENHELFMPKETLNFENMLNEPHTHDAHEMGTEEHKKEVSLDDKESQNILSMRASHDNTALFKVNEEQEFHKNNDNLMRLSQSITNDYNNEQVKSFPTKIDSTIEENKHKNAKMSQEESLVQKLTENNDLNTLPFMYTNENNDGLTEQFKTVAGLDSQMNMGNDQMSMRMIQDQNTAQALAENHQLHRTNDQLKSASDLHNDFHPTADLKSGQNINYEHANMRMTEDKTLKNNLHDSHILPTFKSEEKQHMDQLSSDFKSAIDFHKGHSLTPLTPSGQHNGQHMHNEETNIRMSEGRDLGHQFHNDHDMHDTQSMSWIQDQHDHQHNHQMSHQFNNGPDFHNHHFRPHSHHQHGFMHTHRFGNQFDLDSNKVLSPLSSRTHDHGHSANDGKLSELDSAMQPSSHLHMRDNGPNGWGHHHHSMSRSSYGSSLPLGGLSQGAVGVFPNANTNCGIPLMLSCSPSVVSGSLAKAHPTGINAPAYRSGDDVMFYMKRDTKNTDETPLKIQKSTLNHKTELKLNKQ